MAAPRVRAHARRRARGPTGSRRQPTGHDRRCTAATTGPKASHRRSHPILFCHTPHTHGTRETDLSRLANGVAAVPRPARACRRSPHRPCLDPCGLRALAVTTSLRHELLFKDRSSPVARVAAGHCTAHRRPPLLSHHPELRLPPTPGDTPLS
jgi:hypothetical protein